ncbi:DNA-binding protein [Nitrosopumilus sp. b1]|uniref:DNA-binding protein n=1 Tax=Nitrosopumilus sp. b1 TaxID=2109907 RepID=UPI000E2C6E97|nr:DNA-binding protein [Nitrosopumilus sp. b1]RDJ31826.1 MAG: DNA-binding protein [Thermoproteota archaeon]KAF6242131.1 DNA-binding protein [Nitrosopumilus sp. b1]RDJ34608.1 MAG: DNA-binding protein [Thermoproteota archaeon]RDJ35871.1 MAG: DNA-binding protein [Thermoproteota archaeon]RDJ38448.1 MAG: DNA-binding protein [Thermoproteota archaeon]
MSYPNSDESENQDNPSEAEISAQKEIILKQILDSEARLRLNNVRMVKPDLAGMIENYIIGMASQGKIRSPITDDQLKQILLSTQQPKRDFKINRR